MPDPNQTTTEPVADEPKDPAIHDDVDTYHRMVKWLRNESAVASGQIDKFHDALQREADEANAEKLAEKQAEARPSEVS